jgi:hypothetical protein
LALVEEAGKGHVMATLLPGKRSETRCTKGWVGLIVSLIGREENKI